MNLFKRKPTPSEKSQNDPPPYGDNPLSVGEKISPSNSVDTVASGPPLISGKQWAYWVDWSVKPSSKRNPGLLGAWPYEPRLQRGYGQLFGAGASWKKMASLHPGELDHAIHPDRDWTKHWSWAITIRVHSLYGYQAIYDLRILVKDLPARLQDKEICWNTANWKSQYDRIDHKKEISQSNGQYVRLLAFSTPEPLAEKALHSRSWVGEVDMRYKDKEWLKNCDFRNDLSPQNIKIAEIDQRTASGRCKKVVTFRRGDLYGNDMTGQRVEAWKAKFTESFGTFIKPILSLQRGG